MLRHLAAQQAPRLNLKIDSAGTADYHIGASPDPRSQHAACGAASISVGCERVRSRADFTRFDLILAMDGKPK